MEANIIKQTSLTNEIDVKSLKIQRCDESVVSRHNTKATVGQQLQQKAWEAIIVRAQLW